MSETKPAGMPKPGRPGLQRKDVADAIDALIERGIRDPSLAQLRQHLGRGSNGTISRLRNEIRGERLLATRTPAEGSVESTVLPVLIGAMERLGEEAAKAADDQIDEMRTTFESAQSKMSQERDSAVSAAHDVRIELNARADQVKDLREMIKVLRAELADEKKRLDRSESARHKLEDQSHTLSAELERMTEAHDRLEKTLAEKSTALEQADGLLNGLKKENADLSRKSAELESTVAKQTEHDEQNQSVIDELHATHAAQQNRIAEAEQGRAIAEATAAEKVEGFEHRLAEGQRIIDALIAKIEKVE